MNEFQFREDIHFYQRRFEQLRFRLIRDLNYYLRTNPAFNRAALRKIENYSTLITLTGCWIKLLKDFNDSNGVPDEIRESAD